MLLELAEPVVPPKPVDPPDITPPKPPVPVDPLVQRLQLLYDADTREAAKKQTDRLDLIELYKQAATLTKTPVPKDVMRTSKLMDGVVWDGKDPKKYADGFKIKA